MLKYLSSKEENNFEVLIWMSIAPLWGFIRAIPVHSSHVSFQQLSYQLVLTSNIYVMNTIIFCQQFSLVILRHCCELMNLKAPKYKMILSLFLQLLTNVTCWKKSKLQYLAKCNERNFNSSSTLTNMSALISSISHFLFLLLSLVCQIKNPCF